MKLTQVMLGFLSVLGSMPTPYPPLAVYLWSDLGLSYSEDLEGDLSVLGGSSRQVLAFPAALELKLAWCFQTKLPWDT